LGGRRCPDSESSPPEARSRHAPLPLLGNLTRLLSNGTGTVTLTFTAVLGQMAVDNVYVDSFKVN
jgi:hypothetical protein